MEATEGTSRRHERRDHGEGSLPARAHDHPDLGARLLPVVPARRAVPPAEHVPRRALPVRRGGARRAGGGLEVGVRRRRHRPADLVGERLQVAAELLERPDLELARALPREAEVLAEVAQRLLAVAHDPGGDDVALARIEPAHRLGDAAVDERLLLDARELLVLRLALAGRELEVRARAVGDRRVEREIAPLHALLHLDDVARPDAELLRDEVDVDPLLIEAGAGREPLDLVAGAGEREEELPLRLRGPDLHERPGLQDVVLDVRADPPDRVGDEADLLVGIELLDRLHEPDVPLLDEIGHPEAVRAVLERDLHDEPEVRLDEPMARPLVSLVAERPREAALLLDGEERDAVDLAEVLVEGAARDGGSAHSASWLLGPPRTQQPPCRFRVSTTGAGWRGFGDVPAGE